MTLGEDAVRVKAGNQAQVLALLRGLVITLLSKAKEVSLVEAMERLRNIPGTVHA